MKPSVEYQPICLLQGPAVINIQEDDIPNVFFISDTHFNHKNILHFTNREFVFGTGDDDHDIIVMNNTITDNIISALKTVKHPILIHCGDIIFGARTKNKNFLKHLADKIQTEVPGTRVFVTMGNHDVHNIIKDNVIIPVPSYDTTDYIPNWYWNTSYIINIKRDKKTICQFTVSHHPMAEHFGGFNIHGHLHSESGDPHPQMANHAEVEKFRTSNVHFDCGCDNNHYKPVPLSDILENKTSVRMDQIPQYASLQFKY